MARTITNGYVQLVRNPRARHRSHTVWPWFTRWSWTPRCSRLVKRLQPATSCGSSSRSRCVCVMRVVLSVWWSVGRRGFRDKLLCSGHNPSSRCYLCPGQGLVLGLMYGEWACIMCHCLVFTGVDLLQITSRTSRPSTTSAGTQPWLPSTAHLTCTLTASVRCTGCVFSWSRSSPA